MRRLILLVTMAVLLAVCGGAEQVTTTATIPSTTTTTVVSTTTTRQTATTPTVTTTTVPVTEPEPVLTAETIEDLLAGYLPAVMVEPSHGGRVFCAFVLYGFEQNGDQAEAWVWQQCQEFFPDPEYRYLEAGAGARFPILVELELEGQGWAITGRQEPEDGELYIPSLRDMFPPDVAEMALDPPSLSGDCADQAKEYYGLPLIEEVIP